MDITYGSAGRKPRAPRDSYYLFSDFFSLSDIDLVNLDTSDIKYMFDMFYSRCASLESLNLSSLDISGVESLSGIFNGCTSLRSVDLSNLDTSKVIDMSNMFDGCSSLTSVDNSSPLETSCVNTIAFMFRGCTSLTSLDLSVFESSELKKMEDAFAGCASLQTLDVSDLDTSRVVGLPTVPTWRSDLHMKGGYSLDAPHLLRLSASTNGIPRVWKMRVTCSGDAHPWTTWT